MVKPTPELVAELDAIRGVGVAAAAFYAAIDRADAVLVSAALGAANDGDELAFVEAHLESYRVALADAQAAVEELAAAVARPELARALTRGLKVDGLVDEARERVRIRLAMLAAAESND